MMQYFISPSCTNSIVTRNHGCDFLDGRILKRKTALDSELSYTKTKIVPFAQLWIWHTDLP